MLYTISLDFLKVDSLSVRLVRVSKIISRLSYDKICYIIINTLKHCRVVSVFYFSSISHVRASEKKLKQICFIRVVRAALLRREVKTNSDCFTDSIKSHVVGDVYHHWKRDRRLFDALDDPHDDETDDLNEREQVNA